MLLTMHSTCMMHQSVTKTTRIAHRIDALSITTSNHVYYTHDHPLSTHPPYPLYLKQKHKILKSQFHISNNNPPSYSTLYPHTPSTPKNNPTTPKQIPSHPPIGNGQWLRSGMLRRASVMLGGGRECRCINYLPIMLEAPPQADTDHPEDSYQLYSHSHPHPHPDFDLYQLLLCEPTNSKKPSLLYDYSPPQPSLPDTELPLSAHQHTYETEPVRKCTCSKTRCMKNYCQCFKQGVACSSACECLSCCNREKLFSRRSSGDGRGCNCQKSKCLKNYCECHLNGKRCSPACKCTDCANTALVEDCLELENKAKPKKRRKRCDSH